MRILIVDNNLEPTSWGAADLKQYATRVTGATVAVRRAPHDDLPKNLLDYDRIVLSGSLTSVLDDTPWISHLDEAIRTWVNAGKPFLGVCYGHQALSRALGGKQAVRKGVTPEFGWTQIEMLEDAPLFKGLPKSFHSYSSHYDEVCNLPKGIKRLARSERCEVQACQLEDRPVFGIQFHPERDLETATRSLEKRIKDKKPEPILRMKDGPKLFDSKVGDLIFGNFFAV